MYVNKGTKLVTTLGMGSFIGEIALLQSIRYDAKPARTASPSQANPAEGTASPATPGSASPHGSDGHVRGQQC